MDETVRTPEPVAPKKNNNVLIIVIIVVVLLCCCCLGVIGAGYWLFKNYDTLGDPFGFYTTLRYLPLGI